MIPGMSHAFIANEVATIAAGTVNQVEHLVQIGAVRPAQPALRRGMHRKYDALNLVEVAVGLEAINNEVPGPLVVKLVAAIRNPEYWAKLANTPMRDDTAVLVLMRMTGRKSTEPTVHLFQATEVGEICNTGYTIIVGVPIANIIRRVEEFTGEPLA
jgi:hypothetical protein